MNLTEPRELAPLLEAFLLASGKPQSMERLYELFEEAERPEPAVFKKALTILAKSCEGRAFELKEVASGYRLQSPADSREVRALGRPALGGASAALFAGDAGDSGADCLSPADHPGRDRGRARRGGQQPDRQDSAGARVDPRRGLSRGAGQAGNVRHHQGLSRLLQPEEPRRPAAAGGTARAGAGPGASVEPDAEDEPKKEETSFHTLLLELDSMEEGIKTDFDDLLRDGDVPAPVGAFQEEPGLPLPGAFDLPEFEDEAEPELDSELEFAPEFEPEPKTGSAPPRPASACWPQLPRWTPRPRPSPSRSLN